MSQNDGCIFLDKPKECYLTHLCNARMLQCLINKRHLILKTDSEERLIKALKEMIHNNGRYKPMSGEDGRKVFLRDKQQ